MYEKFTLPNGVRIVTDRMPTVRSASLGVFIGVGSRHETAEQSGASHFIEHLAFKGTPARSAEELAQFMDSSGGQVNAYTSNGLTCFHGRVVDTRLGELAEVLGDITQNSKLD
ncbi:MAG: insulinase family protein, partial [Oscillospiraceae bacterium]|nr:insulinase family protein [Oscillospiraceae bacterium]